MESCKSVSREQLLLARKYFEKEIGIVTDDVYSPDADPAVIRDRCLQLEGILDFALEMDLVDSSYWRVYLDMVLDLKRHLRQP